MPNEISDINELACVIEALLFAAAEPLPLKRIAEAVPEAPQAALKQALKILAKKYEEGGTSLQIVELAGGYELCTKPFYAPFLDKLFEKRRQSRLSVPALETLAIVAYKQPITRAELEVIRGVNCDSPLHSLLERRLVKISGRKNVPGRPFLYRTTNEFLRRFGLKSLNDLPEAHELKKPAQ